MTTEISAREVLDLYREIAGSDRRLPAMAERTYGLIEQHKSVPSADQAYRRLEAFKPTQGWIGFQSANRVIDERGLPDMDDTTGHLLAAEACNADGESLHIRYDGQGRWLVVCWQPVPDGGDYLADIAVHVAHDPQLGRFLRYRRLWRRDGEHGAEPVAACFIGFGDTRD